MTLSDLSGKEVDGQAQDGSSNNDGSSIGGQGHIHRQQICNKRQIRHFPTGLCHSVSLAVTFPKNNLGSDGDSMKSSSAEMTAAEARRRVERQVTLIIVIYCGLIYYLLGVVKMISRLGLTEVE